KERERTGSQSPLMANKDAFTRYSSAYPDFLEAVRFHRAFEEARAKSLLPGQEGQALVGFGDFKFETLDSLYESVDPKQIRFLNYLRRKIPTPGTQMENAIRYTKSQSEDCIKASWFSVCGLRVRAAFSVCGGTAGKDQEAASLGSALPSKPSEEPSEEELIRAVVDMEEYVQAPLPLHPPPASSSAAAQKGAGVSAALDEPTDEELLEAAREQDHALRPPAVVQPAPAPSSLRQPPELLLPDRRSCRA
ncbi:hypothetical protein KUCAC02_031460, partial [Chaenocephalus aceratus]